MSNTNIYMLRGKGSSGQDGSGGDGGGTMHDMEARLIALEKTFETQLPHLATKTDISNVVGEIQKVDTNIHKMDSSIKTWMVGTMLGLFIGFGGMVFGLANFLKPTAQSSAASAPGSAAAPAVTINMPGGLTITPAPEPGKSKTAK